jgi:protein arginine kinase activator
MSFIPCHLCGKQNATIYFKGIVNDQTIKMHLCEACAKKKGMMFPFGKLTQPLGDMISNLAAASTMGSALLGLTCKTCGMGYAEFKQTSQLGCSQCYTTFAPLIGPLVHKIQGSTQHVGKSYRRTVRMGSPIQELSKLKLNLREAIQREAFEEAARLRDEIQKIEKDMTTKPEIRG